MAYSTTGWEFSSERRSAGRHRPLLQRFRHRVRRGRARLPAREAHHGARHRRRRGLVRAVPDAALRPDADQPHRLAQRAADLRGDRDADSAALHRARGRQEDRRRDGIQKQSIPEALREAFGHSGFVLLCSGYFVCGFQLMFISVHFPAYLIDQRMTPETGMMALALIGLFNIFGSYTWGWLGSRYTKKYVLSALYFTRAAVFAIFIMAPGHAVVGLPVRRHHRLPVARHRAGHERADRPHFRREVSRHAHRHRLPVPPGRQLPGGLDRGYLFDTTGSYRLMWLLTIALGILAGLINLPINDKQIQRPAAAPA